MKTMLLPADVQQDLEAASRCMYPDKTLNTSHAQRKLALALLKRGCRAVVEQHRGFELAGSKRDRILPSHVRLHNNDAGRSANTKPMFLRQPRLSLPSTGAVSEPVAGLPAGLRLDLRDHVISDGAIMNEPERVHQELDGIQELSRECLIVLTLDTRYRLIQKRIVSIGTLNAALFHPRECFRAAMLDNAAAIILAHNHPSGDPSPSKQDVEMTKHVVKAGKIVGINVLDHVIIGRGALYSLRENELVEFD